MPDATAQDARLAWDDRFVWRRRRTARWVAAELEGPLNAWLNEGNERAEAALRRNREWGLEAADTYLYDQDEELLTFAFPDRVIRTRFQILGSHNNRSGTWMWAWANDTITPAVKEDSLALRDEGQAHNRELFTTPVLGVSRDDADCLALLALRISRYDGFYKTPEGESQLYLSFGLPLA